MRDEILSKMLEGFLAGLMDGVDVKIEGLKTKTDDGGDETATIEKVILTPRFSQNEGVTALEDKDQSL
jgi:hypothetical protein